MWVLLITLFALTEVGGPVLVVPLPKHPDDPFHTTLEACEKERDRITTEMEAYYKAQAKLESKPYVKDFRMECKPVPRKTI